jgi:hypothetical protein
LQKLIRNQSEISHKLEVIGQLQKLVLISTSLFTDVHPLPVVAEYRFRVHANEPAEEAVHVAMGEMNLELTRLVHLDIVATHRNFGHTQMERERT